MLGRRLDVTITYLEQTERPPLSTPMPPRRKTALLRAKKPPVHFYRYLYRLIGDPYHWVSRRRINDQDLTEIIHDENVFLYILYVDGVPGGMAEIDATNRSWQELKFFGLAPDFHGEGLGRFFLTNVIDAVWAMEPERLRLETCSLDHPAALPLYQKFGFQVFDRKKGVVELID